MAKKKKKRKGNLRALLFANRRNLRALEKEGVSRQELRTAVLNVNAAGEFPTGEDHDILAAIIAAELADTAELPKAINWDKIIELIEKLIPLIQTWFSMCGV